MNYLERTVNKFKTYPSWVLSFVIGRFVKLTGTAGISYDHMSKEKVVVSLKNRPKVRNHIGQIHAAAMMLLAETATGMAMGMFVPDDKLPLIKYMNSKFVRRSQGRMQAEAWLDEDQKALILSEEKGDILVQVKITDESGEEPIICECCWAWVPKKKKK
jgi:acyl-coenzyme A thioesterase PaaI-like protein